MARIRTMEEIDMAGNIQDMYNLLQQLKQDPVNTLAQRKYNIPQGMSNPSDIMQHLLNTGQITQNAVNTANQQLHSPFIQQIFGQRQ